MIRASSLSEFLPEIANSPAISDLFRAVFRPILLIHNNTYIYIFILSPVKLIRAFSFVNLYIAASVILDNGVGVAHPLTMAGEKAKLLSKVSWHPRQRRHDFHRNRKVPVVTEKHVRIATTETL